MIYDMIKKVINTISCIRKAQGEGNTAIETGGMEGTVLVGYRREEGERCGKIEMEEGSE